MATTSKHKFHSFRGQLFVFISALFLVFVLAFAVYQLQREKAYKVDILESKLQTYNYQLYESLPDSLLLSPVAFNDYVKSHPLERLRVTIIDTLGNVLIDSKEQDVSRLSNHLQRREVEEALRSGHGYDIKRVSQSNGEKYFYSATCFPSTGIIVRSAVPYSAELTASLQADHTFIYFAIIVYIILIYMLYRYTGRISSHIEFLNRFAQRAERGELLDENPLQQLPDDELGEISKKITSLYWQMRRAEEDKVRIKHQLTQNTAHELKTPAASIHGYLETLISNPDLTPEQRQHFLERSYAQSQRMTQLLQDMSTLTRLDEATSGNTSSLTKSKIDIVEILHGVLDDCSLQLSEKGIRTDISTPNSIYIQGEHSLIYSIFRNIIDNAMAYATGCTCITIRWSEVEENDEIYQEFTIADDGVGVPEEHLPHLFERFYRVDKGRSRQMGGTGLGLAIVKNAVAFHGGSVEASASQPHGLTVTFTLANN